MATKKKTDYQTPVQTETVTENKPAKRTRNCGSVEKSCKADPQTISEILTDSIHWYGYKIVKTDEECVERLVEFFDYYAKTGGIPTMEKMFLALGTVKGTVWDWEQGTKGKERADIIKRAKAMIAAFDAELAIRGLINPVVYIFRGKNYYGMRDQQDVSVTHTARIEDGLTQDEIRRRLLENTATIPSENEPPTIEVTGEVKE